MLTEKEIEALKVVIGSLHDCWYRDILEGLVQRSSSVGTEEKERA